jgi:phosphinothricin acetyltransferase
VAERLHTRFPWLVATDDRLVGVAYAAPWNDRAAYQWTVEATVYVDPSRHRRGVGDALYTGFMRIGQLVDAGYKRGAWHDVGFWQCTLRRGGAIPPPRPVEE